MIKNVLKSAIRNIWKTKGYSFLNIFGLAVGITAAALIFLWVEDNVTRNGHFPNKGSIHVVKSKQSYDGVTYVMEATPGPLAQAIKNEIPGIKRAVRMDWSSLRLFSVGDSRIYQRGYHADPEVLDLLSVDFVDERPREALAEPNTIVISQGMAERMFGSESAIGKTVRVDNEESYTVSGVFKEFPKNSDFRGDWFINFKKYESKNRWLRDWGANGVMTLVELEPNTDLAQVNEPLLDFAERKTDGQITFFKNFLYPMARWNLYNVFDKDGNEQEGGIKNIRLFSIIAWVVLVIACINFMNLATARSEKRAKEVGMRKVVGASRKALVAQFLGESLIYALLSGLLAIVLVYLFIGPFNRIVGRELAVDLFQSGHLKFLICIVFTCGILAGSYPACYLSSFHPLKTLKGSKQKAGTAGFIRRGLVIVQYTASVVLIICTVIIYQQIRHTKDREMGFNRSQVITTSLRGDMAKHIHLIKAQLKATGGVDEVALSNLNVLEIYSNNSNFDWDGKSERSKVLIGMLHADEDFVPALGMQLYDGRNFRRRLAGDSASVIVNETLAKLITPDGLATGRILRLNNQSWTIVGVVKDFVYNNVFASAPDPVVLLPFYGEGGIINIKTKAEADLQQTLAKIQQVVEANNPDYPFEYRFLDETFDSKFSSMVLIQKLATVFAILSIVVACLGLFGLAAYSAERRAKEVGIRKVLGAPIARLVGMLNSEFLVLVGIACLIAFPVAWWFMHGWLKDYGYRIEIEWTVFGLAALIALTIAMGTISFQAVKAASANPIKALRMD